MSAADEHFCTPRYTEDEHQSLVDYAITSDRSQIKQKLLDALDSWTKEKPLPVRPVRDRVVSDLIPIINRVFSDNENQ